MNNKIEKELAKKGICPICESIKHRDYTLCNSCFQNYKKGYFNFSITNKISDYLVYNSKESLFPLTQDCKRLLNPKNKVKN